MRFWTLGARAGVRPVLGCFHCGLPAPNPCFSSPAGDKEAGRGGEKETRAFCCRACRQVHTLARELERGGAFPLAQTAP